MSRGGGNRSTPPDSFDDREYTARTRQVVLPTREANSAPEIHLLLKSKHDSRQFRFGKMNWLNLCKFLLRV
jgi:hypothetical protein